MKTTILLLFLSVTSLLKANSLNVFPAAELNKINQIASTYHCKANDQTNVLPQKKQGVTTIRLSVYNLTTRPLRVVRLRSGVPTTSQQGYESALTSVHRYGFSKEFNLNNLESLAVTLGGIGQSNAELISNYDFSNVDETKHQPIFQVSTWAPSGSSSTICSRLSGNYVPIEVNVNGKRYKICSTNQSDGIPIIGMVYFPDNTVLFGDRPYVSTIYTSYRDISEDNIPELADIIEDNINNPNSGNRPLNTVRHTSNNLTDMCNMWNIGASNNVGNFIENVPDCRTVSRVQYSDLSSPFINLNFDPDDIDPDDLEGTFSRVLRSSSTISNVPASPLITWSDYRFLVPYLVEYEGDQAGICIGSIINRNTILTAAHCVSPTIVNGKKIKNIRIFTNDRNNQIRMYNFSRVIRHMLKWYSYL